MEKKERPPLITVLGLLLFVQLVYMGIELFGELTSHATGALNKKGELITRMNIPLHIGLMIALAMGTKGVWDMMRWGVYTLTGFFAIKIFLEFSKHDANMGSIALSLICMAAPWVFAAQMED